MNFTGNDFLLCSMMDLVSQIMILNYTFLAVVQFTSLIFFLIGIVSGGVQLGPLGTTATNRPVVTATGDYDDGEIGGMMIGKGNRSTRRKPAPVPLCPPQTVHACPDANPGRRSGKPATNRLSYGTA
jgi:hypothetical protein